MRFEGKFSEALNLVASKAIRTTLALVIVGLSGCTIVGHNANIPVMKLPDFYQTDSGKLAGKTEALVWPGIRDEYLTSLIAYARSSAPDILVAAQRVERARALRRVAIGGLFPDLTANSSVRRTDPSDSSISRSIATGTGVGAGTGVTTTSGRGSYTSYDASLDSSWEIDLFGGLRREVEASNAALLGTEADAREAELTLVSGVMESYITGRTLIWRKELLERAVESQRGIENLTRGKFEAGLVSELDVAQSLTELSSRESEVPVRVGEISASRNQLATLLGLTSGDFEAQFARPEKSPFPVNAGKVPVSVPSELLRRRPDVVRAEATLREAAARVGVAEGDLFPRVYLTGTFGYQTIDNSGDWFSSSSRSWSFGPSVSWPIFAAGKIVGRVSAASADEEAAIVQYKQAVVSALNDVETKLAELKADEQSAEALSRAVTSARRARELSQMLYEKGLSDFVRVLDSERTQYNLEDQYTAVQGRLLLRLVALSKSLGGNWEEEKRLE